MPNANNIVDFTDKWMEKNVEQYDMFEEYDEFDEVMMYFYDVLQDACHDTGIANDSDEFIRDLSYVIESIKSMVERDFGRTHAFHELVDKKLHVTRDEAGEPVAINWIPSLTEKE